MPSTLMHAANAAVQADAGLTDEQLMSGIAAREQPAFDLFYARYRNLISGIVRQKLPSEADANDALQDVFLELWNAAPRFDAARGQPLGWLICLARRRAFDHYQKISRRLERHERLRLESEAGGWDAAGMAAEPETRDVQRFLALAVDELPLEQASVIRLTYFGQMSQCEIARTTGLPLGTIKTRLVLAMRKLALKSKYLRGALEVYRDG